ncbi:MAG: GIY-YIG nuclease family protein [bacterium]
MIKIYIYRLYDEDKNVIYIGQTIREEVKKRLTEHFDIRSWNYNFFVGTSPAWIKKRKWILDVKYYDYAEVEDSKEKLDQYEKFYISSLEPKGNINFINYPLSELDVKDDLTFTNLDDIENITKNNLVKEFREDFLYWEKVAIKKDKELEKRIKRNVYYLRD